MRQRRQVLRRASPLAVVAVLVVVATGCRMQVDVGIDVEEDGSGEVAVAVELDAEAANRLPDLATQLRLDDLEAAGWDVGRPTTGSESTVITATKAFATAGEATSVLQDLSGAAGPFQGLEVSHRSSFLTTTYAFSGVVDLRAGVEGFVDEELRRRLEGGNLSLERADLEALTGAPLEETFGFEVRADLPGSLTVEGAGTHDGDAAVWTPVVGERLVLAASSQALHRQRIASMAISGAALLALVLALARSASPRRSR